MSNTTERRIPYHHGDLHSALVDAGLRSTRTGGPAALSLRDVTRQVGVSPNAAYRHFADRDDLLQAVRARLQQDLADRMHPTPPASGARQQLRAVGLAYIDFALREPGWFELAFGDLQPRPREPSQQGPQIPAPLTRLVAALDALVRAGELSPDHRPGAEWPCWSAVHGFALLALRGPLRGQSTEVLARAAERTVDAVITGLLGATDGSGSSPRQGKHRPQSSSR